VICDGIRLLLRGLTGLRDLGFITLLDPVAFRFLAQDPLTVETVRNRHAHHADRTFKKTWLALFFLAMLALARWSF
jgi:hypothetical protein